MSADILINGITFIVVVATLIFAVWTYIDTKRQYSHQEFIADTTQKKQEAHKRFKERTRLGKRD
ncbi:hypothetical protein [Vibrio sp. 99-70-13A1]|uniref:hypothetical protein n=1 Tax=Vibrio sp. 99-70-13A1 TaxID=2607601 RepID=UPI00149387B9|nr:hypothetical protein [Vibrio sp. 99-70-13A1]NOH95327.1 hypothetical protein [Vibrio sp. 99-70-13A1]